MNKQDLKKNSKEKDVKDSADFSHSQKAEISNKTTKKFPLPKYWIKTTLGEFIEINSGKTRPKKIGEYPVYGGNGILSYGNDYNYINETVIVGRVGTYCGSVYFENKNFWLSDNALGIRNNEKSYIKFLYYFLINQNLNKKSIGGAQPLLTQGIINNLEVIFPPLPQQKKISKILSSFDDKIENIREQNKILEKIGQEIFKEWFGKYSVDKPEELPEGWRVGKITEIMNILSGFAFKGNDFVENGKFGLVTIKNVQDGKFIKNTKDKLNNVPNKMPEHCNLKTGDILLSLTGNVGRICHVIGKNYFLNQRVAKLEPINKKYFSFVYLLFRQKKFLNILENLSSGTAQQNLSPIKTGELKIVIPNIKKLDEFTILANPQIEKILRNLEQIQTLSKTRDILLPKLMKGEIKVK